MYVTQYNRNIQAIASKNSVIIAVAYIFCAMCCNIFHAINGALGWVG